MNSDTPKIAPERVPASFQTLIPWAERFGVPEYVDAVHGPEVTREELLRFWMAVHPHSEAIHNWILSEVHSPESSAFSYMLQALDYGNPDEEGLEIQRRHFWETTLFPNHLKHASRLADEAFKRRDYLGVVAILTPIEKHLEDVHVAKLHYARKNANAAEQGAAANP
jgi:hypothetical protein